MIAFNSIMNKSLFSHEVKTAVKAVFCAFVICFSLSMTEFDAQSREISTEVVRLHIIANSDSEADQAIKLRVRDEIQKICAGLYPEDCTKTEAEQLILRNMDMLVAAAQKVVSENGSSDRVTGELVNMYFTNRRYDEITLPAGSYDALRLTIGSGEGHNWWCVMFPPVCISASGASISDVLTEDQTELVSSADRFQCKFKLYEIYEDIINAADTAKK